MQPGIVVFWLLCSIACYTEAGRFGERYGRTPFGWSKAMWAVVGFLLNIIGICLLGIAERLGRKSAAKQPVGAWQAAPGHSPQYGQPVYGQPARFGQPVYGQPVHGQPAYGSPPPAYPPPARGWGTLPPPPPAPPPPRA